MKSVKLAPTVAWAAPFLEVASRRVSLRRLKKVRGYLTRDSSRLHTQAVCYRHQQGRRVSFTISLSVGHREVGFWGTETLLHALAHEIAHMKHWTHTPEHLRLTALLMADFALVLKRLGVKDYVRLRGRKK